MTLDPTDLEWLADRGFDYEVLVEEGWTNLILKSYELPPGFDRDVADLLVRLSPGFPDEAPDMFWVDPPIKVARIQQYAPQSDVMNTYAGRNWQRFSRHLQPGSWRPGVDSLQSWVKTIQQALVTAGAS